MITVKISEESLLGALDDRVAQWRDDPDTQELYHIMYNNYIYDGCFNGMEIDIDEIVDNDIINYCYVLEEGEEEYELIKTLYEDDIRDCSCESNIYSFIEAEYNGKFLMRY